MTLSTANIRDFLTKYFSDEELTTLCFDHFREVYESFASGITKGQKVQLLLDHCQRHESLPDLLAMLRKERPAQYAQQLGSNASAESPATSSRTVFDQRGQQVGQQFNVAGDYVVQHHSEPVATSAEARESSSDLQKSVDVVILTVLPEEYDAVCGQFVELKPPVDTANFIAHKLSTLTICQGRFSGQIG